MLIEQLIRETLEMQGFRIESVNKVGSEFVATIVPDLRYHPRCGVCGSPGYYWDTLPERRFRHVPLWAIPVTLVYAPCRVTCPKCKSVHVESMPWAAGKKRLTKAFAVALATWAKSLPWLQVARQFQCSWGTVAAAVAYVVAFGLAQRDLSSITHIGIDEISRQKGHVYLTNVYDLRTGTLIWSGEGRGKDTLAAFFEFFGPERTAMLVGICCDMWPSYIEVIKAKAPQAALVLDKFHIVRQLTDAVDKVRRQEVAEKDKEHKSVLAGTRYIWLKNPWNLTDRQKASLSFLETLNLKIHRAYLLKESFRDFWQSATSDAAAKFMDHWFGLAMGSKIKPIQDFAVLLKRHEKNILSFLFPPGNGSFPNQTSLKQGVYRITSCRTTQTTIQY